MYIYENSEWPNFTWNKESLLNALSNVSHRQGRLIGRMEGLGFILQSEAMLQTMTIEVIKSNEIEGEVLDHDQVRSSIARKLGMDVAGLVPASRNVEGAVEIMLDATQKFLEPLTEERLFAWHSALFPTGRSGMSKIVVGNWRTNTPEDPMQVVSGAMGKEKVHFEAPDSKLLSGEMTAFIKWFNDSTELNAIIKAAIAHLWFVTIHPFADGNGRIARTIAEMQLARADGIFSRFYSMSAQIRMERKQYYDILEKTQHGSIDITGWIEWFLSCLDRALIASEESLSNVIYKAKFWDKLKDQNLNDRQRKMINKLLDGFEGKLTTSKWAKICKCSQDTALRDVQDLMTKGILAKESDGGRSTNYNLQNVDAV
ncbi:MAG: Fic family protein [Bacteroidia bacterium]|nr:Fic family protein [Bacteroidia bacterium]